MTTFSRVCMAMGAVFCLQAAWANDAELSYGGSPRLMKGTSDIRMLRERIAMAVGPDNTRVICDFWYRNDGPTVKVRMGFPDEGNNNEENAEGAKPNSNFTSFKSWVDGKAVATTLIWGEASEAWHVKLVTFPAKATVHVRDVYLAPTGSAIVMGEGKTGSCKTAGYIVHTGSSWKGKIGQTDIAVTFDPTLTRNGLRPVSASKVAKADNARDYNKIPGKGTVVYAGLARPGAKGRTLTFRRTNWRPSEKDDLFLYFAFVRPK